MSKSSQARACCDLWNMSLKQLVLLLKMNSVVTVVMRSFYKTNSSSQETKFLVKAGSGWHWEVWCRIGLHRLNNADNIWSLHSGGWCQQSHSFCHCKMNLQLSR